MVLSTSRQRVLNHEFPTASEGTRVVLERMRNESFDELFALYNADPSDDPAGPGTAPGHRFAIEGLDPLEGSPDGMVGEVRFPTLEDGGALELREDSEDAELGMPRDLNGDSILDDEDHAGDYILLPVCITVDWNGRHGPRHIEFFTMFADTRK
jgi:hypothetical protein